MNAYVLKDRRTGRWAWLVCIPRPGYFQVDTYTGDCPTWAEAMDVVRRYREWEWAVEQGTSR